MKTLIVLSDTHGRRGAIDKVAPLFAENDLLVHLGDGSADFRPIFSAYPEKTYVCRGNCDFSYGLDEVVLEEEGVRILCCHGHRYGVKSGRDRLAYRAKELGCDLALYGHTHVARYEELGGVVCINPGSAGSYSDASYCYLVLHRGKITHTFVPIQK